MLRMRDRPTAVILIYELMAIGLYRRLSEAGLSPGRDIAVDRLPRVPASRFLSPTLTCFRLSLRDLGVASPSPCSPRCRPMPTSIPRDWSSGSGQWSLCRAKVTPFKGLASTDFNPAPDRPLCAVGSTDRCNTLGELLRWGLIEQGLSWPFVELSGDGAELGLAVQGQVGARGQILAQQPVGVFVGAALPG